tara:strand:- start:47493 stop:47672 length:180 start_codon:yes stop_codon:yes gene_type:complete
VIIWQYHGGQAQRSVANPDGSFALQVNPQQVPDGCGTNTGDNVSTRRHWSGTNRRWKLQ